MTNAQARELFNQAIAWYKQEKKKRGEEVGDPVFQVAQWSDERDYKELSFDCSVKLTGDTDAAAEYLKKHGFTYKQALSLLGIAISGSIDDDDDEWIMMKNGGYSSAKSREIFAVTVEGVNAERSNYYAEDLWVDGYSYNDIGMDFINAEIFNRIYPLDE